MFDDQAIAYLVDQIWNEYDTDNRGVLDKQQTRKFIQAINEKIGAGGNLDFAEFNEIFSGIQKNANGLVEKNEMIAFFKQMLNE